MSDCLCPGCMARLENVDAPCPYCGWNKNMSNPPNQLQTGCLLTNENQTDSYIIGRSLGQGGFGITYLAWSVNRNEKVVVKEYFPLKLADRERGSNNVTPLTSQQSDEFQNGMNNLLREAYDMLAFTADPNVADIKNFFQANNTAYIIMEFVEGKTLSQILAENRGRLPLEVVLNKLQPIAAVLERMHNPKYDSQGRIIREALIHRDISPDNIIFQRNGTPKLLDFGSARSFRKSSSAIVKSGYSPPEQFSAVLAQGSWTDVYAFAATIYQAITGELPPNAIDRQNHDTLKLPSSLGVKIAPSQEAALLKGLATDYRRRCQTIGEFIAALRTVEPIQIVDKRKIVGSVVLLSLGWLLISLLFILLVYYVSDKTDELAGDGSLMVILLASLVSSVCLGLYIWELVRLYRKKPPAWLIDVSRQDVAFISQMVCAATFVLVILIFSKDTHADDVFNAFLGVYALSSVAGAWLARQLLRKAI